MSPSSSDLGRTAAWSLLAVLLMMALVYAIGYLLHVEEPERYAGLAGGLLVLTVIAYWARKYQVERRLAREIRAQARAHAAKAGPDALRDLSNLEREFNRAFSELAAARPSRWPFGGGPAALPWIIVMGPPAAGKSTALENSRLRFTPLGRRVQGIGGTRHCTFWLTQEAIFLDTAGRYAVQDEDHEEWLSFLKLLRRRRRRRPIDAAILQVSVDEVLSLPRAEVENAAGQLRDRLDELGRHLKVRFPVHLVFNKADRIHGFTEFCAGLDESERSRAWGFSLDVDQLGGRALGEVFAERFSALVGTLSARVTLQLFGSGSRRDQEGVLSFPQELGRRQEALRLFTEALLEDRYAERPRLTTVYLTSAIQDSAARPGARRGLLPELEAPLRKTSGGPSLPCFLAGMFTRVVEQAKTLAQPSREARRMMQITQYLGVGAAMLVCLSGAWLVSTHFREEADWLTRVNEAIQVLSGTKVPREPAKGDFLGAEMDREGPAITELDRGPGGLTSSVSQVATDLVLDRIDQVWLQPLQKVLDQGLSQGAICQRENPDQVASDKQLVKDYQAVKAACVLKGTCCETQAGSAAWINDSRRWIVDYLIGLWQKQKPHPVTPDNEDQLRKILAFFFERDRPSRVSINLREMQRARNLLPQCTSQENLRFYLLADSAGLLSFSNQDQLRSDLFTGSGISEVFTAEGCKLFFNKIKKTTQPGDLGCALSFTPEAGGLDLQGVYRERFREAWRKWLADLSINPKRDPASHPNKALEEASNMLADLVPELDWIVGTLGQGQMSHPPSPPKKQIERLGWFAGCERRTDRAISTAKGLMEPLACTLARRPFLPFTLMTGKDPGDAANSGKELSEAYQRYRTAVSELHRQLDDMHKSSMIQKTEALKLVLETMSMKGANKLASLQVAREDLMRKLRDQGREGGGMDDPASIGALDKLLQSIEHAVWATLVPLAAQGLDEDWTQKIAIPWQDMHKPGELARTELERCKQVIEFLRGKLDLYVNEKLLPFYHDKSLLHCGLHGLEGPFAAPRLGLCANVCPLLHDARKVAQTVCGGGPPIGPPSRVFYDMSRQARCKFQFQMLSAKVETGDRVYECSISTQRCVPLAQARSSGSANLSVKWNSVLLPRWEMSADTYPDLIRQGKKKAGTTYRFEIPQRDAPGRCAGVAVELTLAGIPGPPEDVRWKNYNLLPQSLTQCTAPRSHP